MMTTNPRVRALLRQARKTAGAGKRAAARQLYEQILEEAPQNAEAWIGLAEVTRDPEEREAAYRRALELDADNEQARQFLHGASAADGSEAVEDAEAGGAQDADPFSQAREWLDEATRPISADPVPGQEQPSSLGQEQADDGAEAGAMAAPAPPPETAAEAVADEEAMVCYRHPQRETGLRCYTCDRPICTSCAQHTPVGYRCPQCIRQAQDVFYTAGVLDYTLAGVTTLVLGLLAGAIAPRLGFFVIFIGPAAGTLIGRLAFRAARRNHGRYLAQLVAVLVALGGFLPSGLPLLLALLLGSASLTSLGLGLLWPALYVFLATGAAYYQVK